MSHTNIDTTNMMRWLYENDRDAYMQACNRMYEHAEHATDTMVNVMVDSYVSEIISERNAIRAEMLIVGIL